jgi:hypothetical protein
VLRLRRSQATRHLVAEVEFAAGSHKRWPEATVSVTRVGGWSQETPPEAILLTRFLSRLVAAPDAYDRYYGRLVNAALMELLALLTESVLKSEEKARQGKGYGMSIGVLRTRLDEQEQQAALGLLMLIPERVPEIARPAYARVTATLQTRKAKQRLELKMPPYEPESRNRRTRPEKSLLLGSAALIALVEEISRTQDYEGVVVPVMEELREDVTAWLESHHLRGSPLG